MDHSKQHNIEILPVDTKDQLADIFTKALPKYMFERLRYGMQGIDWRNCTILPIKQGSVEIKHIWGLDDSSYLHTCEQTWIGSSKHSI